MAKKKARPNDTISTIWFDMTHREYRFLSNLFPSPIYIKFNGEMLLFPTAEHLYQSYKVGNDKERFEKIFNAWDGKSAKYWGSERSGCKPRSDWDKIKLKVMNTVINLKFSQNPTLDELLGETEANLIHFAPWDTYWGDAGDKKGNNYLGKIIMRYRDKSNSV